ncbi:MAG: hypothetical protein OXT72_03380 [Gammaproteobacteria bacterium]|nr:hypothetical protein [Gammaproteobacteria bacterium]MDE0246846.1 hypothetical protein [Gammaproteobacteria bacterium]
MGIERVTLRQYWAVEEGMPYGEVVRLLGREGTLDSRTDGSDGPVVANYYWWNDNKSYMEAAFKDDRLVYKNESRLGQSRSWPDRAAPPRPEGARFERIPYVTLRQFRALERGMSYGEVVRLLGREGKLESRTDGFDGPVVASYHWWNDNDSYVEATFENDRLVYKNQSRLRQVDPRWLPPLRLRGLGGDAGSSGRDAEGARRRDGTLAEPHKLLATWVPIGGNLLLAALGFWAFGPGEGPPELTELDMWLPFLAVAGPGLLIAVLVSFATFNPLAGLTVAICAVFFGFLPVYVIGVSIEGEPLLAAGLWWILFLICCWCFRQPVYDDGTFVAFFGYFGLLSLACAALALI